MVIQFITKRIQACLAASRKHGIRAEISLRKRED